MSKQDQITITVKFFATLRAYGPPKETIKVPKNSVINFLFEKYEIPRDERRSIIMVNGRPHQTPETVLNDGDIVAIFPPIGGG